MDKATKIFLNNVLELRSEKKLVHSDLTVLLSIMTHLNFDEERDLRVRPIIVDTDMNKTQVSKAISKLKENKVIIGNEYIYKLNKEMCNPEYLTK